MSVPPLDFVLLFVADLDVSFNEFTQKLGFTPIPEQDSPGFRYLKGGEGGIDFGLSQATEQTAPAGAIELYFKTADLGSLRAALTAKGVTATPIEQRPFASIFTVRTAENVPFTMMMD
jgi:hypothetical protein